jgi:hypothetical protein
MHATDLPGSIVGDGIGVLNVRVLRLVRWPPYKYV